MIQHMQGLSGQATPGAMFGPQPAPLHWRCEMTLQKYWQADYEAGRAPYDVVHRVGNLSLIGGASVLWTRCITANPSTAQTGAGGTQAFSSANAVIGVSSSTSAVAAASTSLPGSPIYSSMTTNAASTYGHTDSATSTAARTMTFAGSWGATQANFQWRKWGVANSTAAAQRWLNQTLQNLGTKTTGTWTLAASLTLTT